jgi:hypothetical protein
MAVSDKAELFSRLQELHNEQGKTWKEIAHILKEEGYQEKGESLTDNALRKRYTKWGKSEEGIPGESSLASEPESKQEQGITDFDRLQKSRMDSALKGFGRGGSISPGSVEDAIASLVALNNELLAQVQESNRTMKRLEKHIEEQQTSHTGSDTEQPVSSRDLLELLKEIGSGRQQMQFIEEERKDFPPRAEVQQLIDEIVAEKVESELKAMLAEEGSFSRELAHLVDQRLKTLFSGCETIDKTRHAGPGRGKKGKSHVKFSASLESNLYARAKSLPGQFSRHLANALSTYLSVMEEKKQD